MKFMKIKTWNLSAKSFLSRRWHFGRSLTNNHRGMTLLEIMIVLAILGSLIGILATQVQSRLKRARMNEARIQIGELGKALDMFYTDCGFYPSTEDGLSALVEAPSNCATWGPDPYIRRVPTDPWQTPFIYENTGGSYILISLGSDKREGGTGDAADISSEDL